MENIMEVLKHSKIEVPYNSAITLLSMNLKKMRSLTWTAVYICSLKLYSQQPSHEITEVSTDGWMDKENMAYAYIIYNIHI